MATVTNLTNTTWVFKLSKLNFQHWVLKKINIVFISNSTTYSAMSCKIHAYESSIEKYCDSLYYETPNASKLAYRCEYVGNSYDVDRYTLNVNNVPLTIIDGDVFNSSLIKFLSNNATCQTTLVTVTFNMNGKGTAVDSQVFASGEKAIMPIITPDENYIFAGWYTDSGLTTRFDFNTSVDSNITLYAKWIPKTIKTKVNGAWNSGTPLVKVNNTWKDVDKAFVKVNGVWQSVINNVPPSPVVSTFKIENITYTFEEGMTWNDWVLSSKYSKSTSGMNIPSSPTSAGFHGELSSSVEITDNSEAYESGAGYVCVGWGDSKEEAYWDLLVYTPDIYSLIRKVRSWEIIFPNQEYFIKWA